MHARFAVALTTATLFAACGSRGHEPRSSSTGGHPPEVTPEPVVGVSSDASAETLKPAAATGTPPPTAEDEMERYRDAFALAGVEVEVALLPPVPGNPGDPLLAVVPGEAASVELRQLSRAETLAAFDRALAGRMPPTLALLSSPETEPLAEEPPPLTPTTVRLDSSNVLPLAVVVDGRPTTAVKSFVANTIPRGAAGVQDFTGCSQPAAHRVKVFARNILGLRVAELEVVFTYQYHCRWKGEGAFLAHVRIHPTRISVFWGFHLDFKIEDLVVSNIGGDDEDVAAMQLFTRLDLRSFFSHDVRLQTVTLEAKNGVVRVD